jgi:2-(1,2-epoxy-1,2-dihydrophenyl)acetyl-CoA isomerase
MYNTILFDLKDGVATLTLNRPDRFNAFNNEMSFEFIEALKECRKNTEVRTVIITGAGDKAFSSGQDLKDIQGTQRSIADSVAQRYNPKIKLITGIEKPILCKLNGIAAGAGAGIALACDMVIAAEHASLLFAFINIGLVPDSGGSYTLPRILSRQQAFEVATSGDKIDAQTAFRLGMVNRVVPAADLDTVTYDLAAKYAAKPPIALALTKRMLNRSLNRSLDEMLEMEMHCQSIAGNSEDYKEGVAAFIEKRAPQFKGK